MNIATVAVMFLAIWGWLAYEIYYAPEYDENEMPVKKPSKRVKHRFHVDIDEGEINDDLFKRNDKEDTK